MATLYYYKNLPKTGEVIEESKISVSTTGCPIPEIDYWIKFKNFGWVHLPIDDPKLDKKLKEVNFEKNEYSLEEFEKLIA